jgi:cyclopropane fatty-acyl-phospholipid synthase-like methyltransferase
MAAGLGLDATSAGLAPSAPDTARHKARQRGRTTRFLRHDTRNLAGPGESFDTVLDCGLFHIFGDGDRATYAGNLRSAVAPCGRYFLLCCSDTLTRT